MNEELQAALLDMLSSGKDFVLTHAPVLFQETILWAQIQALVYLVLLLVYGAGVGLVVRWTAKWDMTDSADAGAKVTILTTLFTGGFILLMVFIFGSAVPAIHATVAPHSYLVSLITGH